MRRKIWVSDTLGLVFGVAAFAPLIGDRFEGSYMAMVSPLHIGKCVSKTNCISFLYQDGKFDFLPVNP